MTLSADILALSPVLYWKLDDASGPAASDSSGHSHPGVYGGTFTLHQYGPEPATYAAQFAAGGTVTCTGFPQPGTSPFTVIWYSSRNVIATPTQGDEFSFGARASNRGCFGVVNNANNSFATLFSTAGGAISSLSSPVPIWNKWWHAYGIVWNGSGGVSQWVDGSQVNTSGTLTMQTILSTDTFGLTPPYAAVLAHLAYYDKALTAANIAQLHGYRFDWPFGPMVNVTWPSPPSGGGAALSPSDPVVVDINTDLSDIRRAVLYDYTTDTPPA